MHLDSLGALGVVDGEGQLLWHDALVLASEDTGFWNMMFLFKSAELVDHTSSAGNPITSYVHGCFYAEGEGSHTVASAFNHARKTDG